MIPRPRMPCQWCGGNARNAYCKSDVYKYGWQTLGFCSLVCAERFAMQMLAQGETVDVIDAATRHPKRPYMSRRLKRKQGDG